MWNSDQTQIFHKAGQTCLTWTKHNLVDLMIQITQPNFNPDSYNGFTEREIIAS